MSTLIKSCEHCGGAIITGVLGWGGPICQCGMYKTSASTELDRLRAEIVSLQKQNLILKEENSKKEAEITRLMNYWLYERLGGDSGSLPHEGYGQIVYDYIAPNLANQIADLTQQLAAANGRVESDAYVMVPKNPPIGLLISMAIRSDHGLGVPGYYDTLPIQLGMTHNQLMGNAINSMRQLYEEAIQQGFYSTDRESEYAAMLSEKGE